MSVDEVGRVAVRGAEVAARPPSAQLPPGLAVETPVYGRRPETLRGEGSASGGRGDRNGEGPFERPRAGFEPVEYPDPGPSLPPPPVPVTELPGPAAADGRRDTTAEELAGRPGGARLEATHPQGPFPDRGAESGGVEPATPASGLAEVDRLARVTLGRATDEASVRPVDPSLAGSRLDARV